MNTDPAFARVKELLRIYLVAERVSRENPQSWKACRPAPGTPEAERYDCETAVLRAAKAELWMATDFEYDDSAFRKAVWEWRYWKVMARKCCWYQRFGTTWRAKRTMSKLHEAEWALVKVCELLDFYQSPCEAIEKAFPKLRRAT